MIVFRAKKRCCVRLSDCAFNACVCLCDYHTAACACLFACNCKRTSHVHLNHICTHTNTPEVQINCALWFNRFQSLVTIRIRYVDVQHKMYAIDIDSCARTETFNGTRSLRTKLIHSQALSDTTPTRRAHNHTQTRYISIFCIITRRARLPLISVNALCDIVSDLQICM